MAVHTLPAESKAQPADPGPAVAALHLLLPPAVSPQHSGWRQRESRVPISPQASSALQLGRCCSGWCQGGRQRNLGRGGRGDRFSRMTCCARSRSYSISTASASTATSWSAKRPGFRRGNHKERQWQ